MNYKLVEGRNDLVRDVSSNAIINTDKNLLDKTLAERKKRLEEKSKIGKLENRLNTLEEKIDKLIGILSADIHD